MAGRTLLCLVLDDVAPELLPIRREFHPGAVARKLPLHVTLLYPFVPWEECDDAVLARVRRVCGRTERLMFSLGGITTFPGGFVCVEPEPDAGIRALMRALWQEFPETPPYAGEVDDPHPHATLGWSPDGREDQGLADAVRARAAPLLPFPCVVDAVALLVEGRLERWRQQELIPLRGRS